MTAVQERPRTVLRAEVVPPDAPTPAARPPALWPRLLGSTLLLLAAVLVWVLAYALVFSGLSEARAQRGLYARLRSELATGNAPIAQPITPGAPVALLDVPAAGIKHVVVVEGTTSTQTADGPGHLRSSVLPGQTGASVILGRSTTYGAPFAHVARLRAGDALTVTTGQGRFRYRVVGQRRSGDPLALPAGTRAVLTLVTSDGTGVLGGFTPDSAVYVTAVLTGTPQTGSVAAGRPASAERPMQGDYSFASLAGLVLALQLLALVLGAVTWARLRWSPLLAHVLGLPLVLAALWFATQAAARLLPNLV